MLIHFLLTLSLLLPLYLRRIILLRYKQGIKIKGFSRFQLLSTRCSPAGRSVTCRIKQAVSGSCWGMTAHGQTDVQDHSRLVGEPVLQETTQKAIASIVKLTGNILWKKDQGLREEGEMENAELSFNGYRVSVWEDEKVLEIDDGDGCTTTCMDLMPLNSILLYIFHHN